MPGLQTPLPTGNALVAARVAHEADAAGCLRLAGFDRLRDEVGTTGLVEDQIARRLQGSVGAPTKPKADVSSRSPPEMLLGHIDRVRVRSDQMNLQGVAFYDARADLRGVNVSLPSLLEGRPKIGTRRCSLGAAAPAVRIDQNQACLGYLGLGPV